MSATFFRKPISLVGPGLFSDTRDFVISDIYDLTNNINKFWMSK